MADINLLSLIDRFTCDDTYREALEQARWHLLQGIISIIKTLSRPDCRTTAN